MHELSLCQALLQLLRRQAAEQRFNRIKQVWLEIGALAAVDPDAMSFAFMAASQGTLADGAVLHLLYCPGRGRCRLCHAEVEMTQWYQSCPRCGAFQLQALSGEGVTIRELEVE
ncbi:hydrogenase maturation nickel metallochaperone HypA [Marinobacterium marinum]|uniref:Hydrogenase maturation factor HypA n=1 Tax=Marinobacterium marinum TaxID=2756129 RepID=A0A7W1WX05_9GAMM|nr:hydrogenase maturation nickel metallochaperone HypA [Marinobacterium marinum]MBA4501789.1 hydrogenase maturation nickel metallochaperone HypA [Marinobacterium marinum]